MPAQPQSHSWDGRCAPFALSLPQERARADLMGRGKHVIRVNSQQQAGPRHWGRPSPGLGWCLPLRLEDYLLRSTIKAMRVWYMLIVSVLLLIFT